MPLRTRELNPLAGWRIRPILFAHTSSHSRAASILTVSAASSHKPTPLRYSRFQMVVGHQMGGYINVAAFFADLGNALMKAWDGPIGKVYDGSCGKALLRSSSPVS